MSAKHFSTQFSIPPANWVWYVGTVIFAGIIALLIGVLGVSGVFVASALIVGIPISVVCVKYIHWGTYVVLVFSFFLLGMLRFTSLPLGLSMDVLVLLLLIGFFIKPQAVPFQWSSLPNLLVLCWIGYNIFQVLNPNAASREAWMYTIRGMAGIMVLFFIAQKAFDTFGKVELFVEIWIALAVALAAYGTYQELHGLSAFEEAWVRETEQRFLLYFNWGRFRKFSFFSDPTTFGITTAYSGILCWCLAAGAQSIWRKLYLGGAGGLMFVSMVFSGTRTAYVMLPAALVFYALLYFRTKVIILSFVLGILGAAVLFSPIRSFGPLDEGNLTRLRSAFTFQEDASFNVRLKNQAFIQPYIQTHPIGGGLGSTGEWGKRFSPYSPLANFPPDSGFVKIAVEQGWLGLILYTCMLFVVLRKGINNFATFPDGTPKTYTAALLTTLYAILVANYGQEAITMYPTSVLFYCSMAIVCTQYRLDYPSLSTH